MSIDDDYWIEDDWIEDTGRHRVYGRQRAPHRAGPADGG
jgi:hypothetical protein